MAAAQEERFSRIKHTEVFPEKAIQYCMEESALSLNDLDAVVFYDKPLLKFERLLETHYAFAPKGFRSFLKSMPVWLDEKLFLRSSIQKSLKSMGMRKDAKVPLLFCSHHLSHAASAFYASPFKEAAILCIDGVGEWATATIAHGKGNEITLLQEMRFPHSLGLFYSAFTYFLGFKVNSGEYKLMGLAPYGIAEEKLAVKYEGIIRENLITVHEDGSLWLNQSFFSYSTGLRMVNDAQWEKLFGLPKRKSNDSLGPEHKAMALAVQRITEDVVLKMAAKAKALTGSENLCMAGGVALNCTANGVLRRNKIFSNIWVQPAAGDAGGALGAALSVHHQYYNEERPEQQSDLMQGAFLGPSFSDEEIQNSCRAMGATFNYLPDAGERNKAVAALLAEGKIAGWFQGRMEFGPRALGNRSILADASIPNIQSILNQKIKFREGFRPFAPMVLEEDVAQYFEEHESSPYMLFTVMVKSEKRTEIPGVTHVDGSARIQTISENTQPDTWNLLQEFKKITGKGILINTSFNVRGEPPVCTPEDAYTCFMHTEMDVLVMGNCILKKEEQSASVFSKINKQVIVED